MKKSFITSWAWLLYFSCVVAVCVLGLFFNVPWFVLQSVMVILTRKWRFDDYKLCPKTYCTCDQRRLRRALGHLSQILLFVHTQFGKDEII